MIEDIEFLSRRLNRARLNPEPGLLDCGSDDTDLPNCIGPFTKVREYNECEPLDTWRVYGISRSTGREITFFGGIANEFEAARKLIDCLQAWEIIKPVERVYFIGTKLEAGCLIKVGRSLDPEARLRTLQTAHGEKLHIFATVEGGRDLEQRYHRRWRRRRREGEWFAIGDCITQEIERLNSERDAA